MTDNKTKADDLIEDYKFVTPKEIEEAVKTGKLNQTIFGMSCFWGPDANFGSMPGVVQTRVGYAGASTLEPNYQDIKGHAEVVKVIYDKDKISYKELLGDPETWSFPGNKQGQYRPLLFVFDEEQKQVVEDLIKEIGKENAPEVIEAGDQKSHFWTAEDYHQKHRLRRNEKFVKLARLEFGARWDEHLYFTKLNGDGKKGFNASQWLKKLPQELQKAYRTG